MSNTHFRRVEGSIQRIDGAVGLIMAMARATLENGPLKSVYDGMSEDQIKERMGF